MHGARFDDLATGRSFRLDDLVTTHTAEGVDDVIDVLERAQEAAAEGHWVAGYVAYDAAPAFDPALVAHRDHSTPAASFGVFREARETTLPAAGAGSYSISRWIPLTERGDYDKAFMRIKDHIEVGDAYQVALTFPLRASFAGDASKLYADLVASQRPAYAAHLWSGDTHILSISPEQFFRIDGRHITSRPMKGTRPRGRWAAEDAEHRADLFTSDKDRAENVMIVDLIRNDLGRVATFGSVAVDEMFAIERYPTVWQMTSQISADLRPGVRLTDVFNALFPCGSVTGAPKARAMEIITDVEPLPRGVYCGAVGFIPPGDGVDGATFNVAIRTGIVDDSEGVVSYGVGSGITWGSELDHEYDESRAKSRVLTAPRTVPALVETIRWDDGWLWLDEHMERMGASADYLGIAIPTEDIRAALAEASRVLDRPSRVRVVLGGDRDVSVTVDDAPVRFAMGPGPDSDVITYAVDLDPVDRAEFRLFHKTTDRSIYESRRRRHGYADEVLLTNEEGRVTEGTVTNVAILRDGSWVTPPVAEGLLPGVMRQKLVERGTLREEPISVHSLVGADAVAVFNSVQGWRVAIPASDHGLPG
ncbi:MAG: aminodeoxychorismate synthase component I [Acidimicrobiia bacterium]|nr:aminodeoxychorismate synthase component I [Acidimicrobiia bacterium]